MRSARLLQLGQSGTRPLFARLVQTCKAHQVDPFAYLRDVIDRVSTHPMSRIDELTPRRWKELRQQAADANQAA
jgi:hypothetical protein